MLNVSEFVPEWKVISAHGEVLHTQTQLPPPNTGSKLLVMRRTLSVGTSHPKVIYHYLHQNNREVFAEAFFGENRWVVEAFGINAEEVWEASQTLMEQLESSGKSPVRRTVTFERKWRDWAQRLSDYPQSVKGYLTLHMNVKLTLHAPSFSREEKSDVDCKLYLLQNSVQEWDLSATGREIYTLLASSGEKIALICS